MSKGKNKSWSKSRSKIKTKSKSRRKNRSNSKSRAQEREQETQQEQEQKPVQEQEQEPSKVTVEIKIPLIINTLSEFLLAGRGAPRLILGRKDHVYDLICVSLSICSMQLCVCKYCAPFAGGFSFRCAESSLATRKSRPQPSNSRSCK